MFMMISFKLQFWYCKLIVWSFICLFWQFSYSICLFSSFSYQFLLYISFEYSNSILLFSFISSIYAAGYYYWFWYIGIDFGESGVGQKFLYELSVLGDSSVLDFEDLGDYFSDFGDLGELGFLNYRCGLSIFEIFGILDFGEFE